MVCGAGEGERKRDRAGHKVRTEMVGPTRGRTVISQGKGRRAPGEETVGENERGGDRSSREKSGLTRRRVGGGGKPTIYIMWWSRESMDYALITRVPPWSSEKDAYGRVGS